MLNLLFSSIHLPAVLTAWAVHIIMGMLWFSSPLFGKEWSRLTGKELAPDKKWIVPGFLGHLLMIVVMTLLIRLTNTADGLGGLFLGLLTWAGFIVPMETGELVWERIPFRLFLLRTGNQLLGLAVSGFILGAWR